MTYLTPLSSNFDIGAAFGGEKVMTFELVMIIGTVDDLARD
jgi:hypothetical protein